MCSLLKTISQASPPPLAAILLFALVSESAAKLGSNTAGSQGLCGAAGMGDSCPPGLSFALIFLEQRLA
jgi:hypothetical protein